VSSTATLPTHESQSVNLLHPPITQNDIANIKKKDIIKSSLVFIFTP
jgi:hypothetical protein